jgi:peroxiredoxin
MLGFDALNAQFEAAGAQVVGISADHFATLDGWKKANPIKHTLLSDFRRQMLPAYGALEMNEASPIYRYAKRAYFIIDKSGTVKYVKVMDNPLNLLNPDEVLAAVKAANMS